MTELERIVERTRAIFEDIDATVFADDRTVNRRLRVEIVDPALAGDTPTLVLVTPWTVNGLFFPPAASFPDRLEIDGRMHRVFARHLEGVGCYCSVTLAPDVASLPSQSHARKVARSLGAPFRAAVMKARLGEVPATAALRASADD